MEMPKLSFVKNTPEHRRNRGVNPSVLTDLQEQISERRKTRCCNRINRCCGASTLGLINFVDLAAGCVLLVYGVYYEANGFAPLWLYAPMMSVGAALVAVAVISTCSLETSEACPCCCDCVLQMSGYISPLVCLTELVFGVLLLVRRP